MPVSQSSKSIDLRLESIWGADPLEWHGGFHHLQYDPTETFSSTLATNGSVGWGIARAHLSTHSQARVEARLNVTFPEIDWKFLQSVYGWSALQYQLWARGSLEIKGTQAQTVAFFGSGLLEFWVDNEQYFGGDFYQYHRAPNVLQLSPGRHVIELRLIRDVRALGVLYNGAEAVVHAELRQAPITLDHDSLLVPELAGGKLGGTWASINAQNNGAEPVEIISIRSLKVCIRSLLHILFFSGALPG